MPEVDQIRLHLQQARNYFEMLSKQPAGNYLFERFPIGCCGNVSHILGCFFISQGYANVRYVAGERTVNGQYQTHAWLEWDSWIIDITADQFSDGPSAVFLERGSEFHDLFIRQGEYEPCRNDLQCEYLRFLDYMR